MRVIKLLGAILLLTLAPAAVQAADSTVDMRGNAFGPSELTIQAGDSVTWTNKDAAIHDAAALDGSWTTPKLNINEEATLAFDTAGTFEYRCTIHPQMRGTLTVTEAAAEPTQPPTDAAPTAPAATDSASASLAGPAGVAALAGLLVWVSLARRRAGVNTP